MNADDPVLSSQQLPKNDAPEACGGKTNAEDGAEAGKKADRIAKYRRAWSYVDGVAQGTVKVDLMKIPLSHVHRVDEYSEALMTCLAYHLDIPESRTVALALAFMARQLTNRTVTSQNELAVLLHGTQYATHDLAIEVREFRELALAVADQESFTIDPAKS